MVRMNCYFHDIITNLTNIFNIIKLEKMILYLEPKELYGLVMPYIFKFGGFGIDGAKRSRDSINWLPPEKGWVKVNID